MAQKFIDSMGHYTTIANKYKLPGSGTTPSINASAGRRGGPCLRFNLAVGTIAAYIGSLGTDTWIATFSMKTSSLSQSTAIISGRDTTVSQSNCALIINTDGSVACRRAGSTSANIDGNGTVVGTSAPSCIIASTWHTVEIKTLIHASAGTFQVKVDGALVLDLSGVVTKPGSGTTATNALALGSTSSLTVLDICDLKFGDTSGSANNDWYGPVRTDAHFMNAVGANNGSTSSSGGARYTNVDESAPNSDTDYNAFTAASQKDTYGHQSLIPTGQTITGFQICAFVEKLDVGSASARPLFRHSGTDNAGTTVNVPQSYAYHIIQSYDVNPGTSATLTEADFNVSEVGLERVA